MQDLWSSIFTAGPTPTLLLATNATFAALQTLLFVLLLATSSIHFAILSVLSGALWYSINWFAQELKQVQAQTAGQETQSEKSPGTTQDDAKVRETVESADSDTETEDLMNSQSAASSGPPRSALQVPGSSSDIRKRPGASGDSSGYTSTDSEWEKVDKNL